MSSKHITPYEDIAIENANFYNLKQLASAILLSAIEDADVEFLTDDYDEWKIYRIKRQRKSDVFNEIDYRNEFRIKQIYKESLFDICDICVTVNDIPKEIMEERKMYESNKIKDLIKLTKYKKETLGNIAKIHGWKIGVNWVQPTIFDL